MIKLKPFLSLFISGGLVSLLYLVSPQITAQLPVTVSEDAAAGHVHTIRMSNTEPSYAPGDLTIEVGDTVKWLNAEKSDTHSIHERTGAMISPDVAAGKQWCYRFMTEGEYNYTCRFHPWMKGKITVKVKDLSIREVELPRTLASKPTSIDRIGEELWVRAGNSFSRLSKIDEVTSLPPRMKLTPVTMTAADTLCLFSEQTGRLYLYNLRNRDLRPISTQRFNFKPETHAITGSGELVVFDNTARGFVSINLQSGHSSLIKQVTLTGSPVNLIADGRGTLWFIEQSRTVVGSFDAGSMEVKEYPLPSGANLTDIAASNHDQVYLTDAGRNKLIRVENGWLNEYTIPTSFSSPQGLSVGRDGRVWFTEALANKLGFLQDGRFQEYAVPAGSEPASPRIDSQGNLWFIGRRSGKLGFLPAETLQHLSSPVTQLSGQPCSPSGESTNSTERTGGSRDSH